MSYGEAKAPWSKKKTTIIGGAFSVKQMEKEGILSEAGGAEFTETKQDARWEAQKNCRARRGKGCETTCSSSWSGGVVGG